VTEATRLALLDRVGAGAAAPDVPVDRAVQALSDGIREQAVALAGVRLRLAIIGASIARLEGNEAEQRDDAQIEVD